MTDISDRKPAAEILKELLTDIINKEQTNVYQEIIANMLKIFEIKTVTKNRSAKRWRKTDMIQVYELLGIEDNPEKITPAYKKKINETNKAVYHILKLLKKFSVVTNPEFPQVEARLRADLAVEQDNKSFYLLDEYHKILQYLQKKKPSNRKLNSTVHLDFPLILIGLDGLIKTGIDHGIARLQAKHIHTGSDSRIEVPVGRQNQNSHSYKTKAYPISSLSCAYLKVLLPRCKKGYLFPNTWREKSKGKSKRREALEKRLAELWLTVHPDKAIPENWNINLWIRLSKLSLSVLGTPYLVISSLSGKLNAAQLLREDTQPAVDLREVIKVIQDDSKDNHMQSYSFDIEHEIAANNIFMRIRSIILNYSLKAKDKPTKKKAANQIESLISEYQETLSKSPNIKLLIEWIVWTLLCQKYRKNKLSTFLTYFSILPCRLLPILGSQQISLMTDIEWIELASYFASDIDYASSSKRQTIAHLRSLHTYLVETDPSTPEVDWSNYAFRIQKGIAGAKLVKPHEVERLLQQISSGDPNWLVIVLAFYGGFRCEEICGLTINDFIDGYRLNIAWSKRHTSRRSVPISWLIPRSIQQEFQDVLERRIRSRKQHIVTEENGEAIKPNTLGKRISRLLAQDNISVHSIHALRHGFASWTLIRYFMLVDPVFCTAVREGKVVAGVDSASPLFSNESLQDLARTMGGTVWEKSWLNSQCCLGAPTDITQISSLMGHTNRYTPIENYFNSMESITRYYLKERMQIISSLYS